MDLTRFNRRLQRRHPKVRMRRSESRDLYILEERVAHCRELDPAIYRSAQRDSYIQHRDGYSSIEHFRTLPSVARLSDALEASRISHLMAATGARDAAHLADMMDAEDEAKRAARDRQFHTLVEGVASDAYEAAQWRTGSRVGGRAA